MDHRLFAAIFPPRGNLEKILEVQSGLRHLLGRASWTRPDRIHMTLRFFGDVDLAAAEQEILEAIAGLAPFQVTLSRVGGFPRVSRARVVTLVAEPEETLLLAMKRLSPEVENPAPHITLARLRTPMKIPTLRFEPIAFDVRTVLLMNSVLRGRESRYEMVREFLL